ncbi:hypothetical protein M758_1G178600 [Ceratodon purpureus]|nr:hypothetical protein M758_1G178600 [Ceratodon purpureus]
MALATQALLCPQQLVGAVSTCSTSTSASQERVSAAAGLRVGKWGVQRGTSHGVSVSGVGSVRGGVRAAANASSEFQSTFTAKELERDAAKEALLLAIADAGGVEALTSTREDAAARINVSEKLLVLERLNPTPRPTTSPLLEGLWEFKWAAARSPGTTAARALIKRFPTNLASLSSLNILILDGTTKATATLKLFGSVESSFVLSTKLTAEGPTRLKEEYVEGNLSSPNVIDVPSGLKGVYDQLVSTVERLPAAVKDVVSNGIRVPLTGSYERQLLISYLDEEIMVARDESGVPDILYKIQAPIQTVETVTIVPEYLS